MNQSFILVLDQVSPCTGSRSRFHPYLWSRFHLGSRSRFDPGFRSRFDPGFRIRFDPGSWSRFDPVPGAGLTLVPGAGFTLVCTGPWPAGRRGSDLPEQDVLRCAGLTEPDPPCGQLLQDRGADVERVPQVNADDCGKHETHYRRLF